MTMTNTLKNKIFHGFLKPMQESVSNGTLNAEELYRDLCIIVRLESDTESDAMCVEYADEIYVKLTGYIPANLRAQLNIPR